MTGGNGLAGRGVVAVAGATGRQGGAVARRLHREGWSVRGLTRRADGAAGRALADEGIAPVQCDFADDASIRTALSGADRLFLTTTPYEDGVGAEERQALAAIAAARDLGLAQIVYSSVAAADRPTGVAHFESKGRVEKALVLSGVERFAIIRPAFFMEMLLQAPIRSALQAGRVALTIDPATPIAMTATSDIASFAAHAMADPERFHGAAIDLAGDQPTISGLVEIMASSLGHPIAYERVSEAEFDPAMRPSLVTQRWLAKDGWRIDVAALAARWGIALCDLASWTSAHRELLLMPEEVRG